MVYHSECSDFSQWFDRHLVNQTLGLTAESVGNSTGVAVTTVAFVCTPVIGGLAVRVA